MAQSLYEVAALILVSKVLSWMRVSSCWETEDGILLVHENIHKIIEFALM